jgi:uncharacterized membrane protein
MISNLNSIYTVAIVEFSLFVITLSLMIGNIKKMRPAWKQTMTQYLIGIMVFDLFLYLSRFTGILTNNLTLRFFGPLICGLVLTIGFIQWGVRFMQFKPKTVKMINLLFAGSLIWFLIFRIIADSIGSALIMKISVFGLFIYLFASMIMLGKMISFGLYSPYPLARRRITLMCGGIIMFLVGELMGVFFMSLESYFYASLAFLIEIPAWILISLGIRMPRRFNELLSILSEKTSTKIGMIRSFPIKTVQFLYGNAKSFIIYQYTLIKLFWLKINAFVRSFYVKTINSLIYIIKKLVLFIKTIFSPMNLMIELIIIFVILLSILKLGTAEVIILSANTRFQIVSSITISLVLFAIVHGAQTLGKKQIFLFFDLVFSITIILEYVGVTTGLIFGDYYYTSKFGPLILGTVPIMIPLAWFCLFYVSFQIGLFIFDYNFETPLSVQSGLLLSIVQSFIMTFWDISKDVEAVFINGYWVWENVNSSSAYFGIPVSNYIGWFVTSLLIYGTFNLILSRKSHEITVNPDQLGLKILLPIFVYFILFLNEFISHIQYQYYTVSVFSIFTMGFVCLMCYVEYVKRNRLMRSLVSVPEITGTVEIPKDSSFPSFGS